MDVRCERCSTEYEFDDALVSGRGTTVKCTNCGHKFKIRRSDGDFSEDFWNIQTGDGRTLVFTSLRELQRAIQTNLVERSDLLSRGGLKQKPIGQIPELSPFFDQRDPRRSLPPSAATASASEKRSSRPPPPPGVAAPSLAPPARQRMGTLPDFPPEPPPPQASPTGPRSPSTTTLVGTGAMDESESRIAAAAAAAFGSPLASTISAAPAAAAPPSEPPARAPSEAPPTDRESEPDTERFAREHARADLTRTQPIDPPPPRLVEIPRYTPPPTFEPSSPLPPATARPKLGHDVDHDAARGSRSSLPDSHPPSTQRRRGVGGYVVAFVVLAGVALIGVVWARDNLGGFLGKPPAPVATTDPRVSGFLATGEKALADGNVDLAKESFDKASALAEKDPHVLLDVARLAAVRADTSWLEARLLSADAFDEIRSTKDSLDERSAAARKAADDALAVAPDDPAALRAKIDALRIAGERDAARALVGKITPSSTQPETAYVLAGLDLADAEPLWSTVLERLRVAANAEAGPGRARATLVYALARSGDVAGAKAEVERLASMPRQHPLLPLLRSFAANARPVLRVDSLPDAGPVAAVADAGRVGRDRGGRPLSNDARVLVQQGEQARARGDLDRAQVLFGAALDRNANDTEALNGMAAIAHSRHDLIGARASYKRVLSINPGYVPALVGLGDVEFESGDRAAAMKTYKDVVDRYPEGTYPARVKQRLGNEPRSTATPSSSGVTPPVDSSPTPTPAPSDTGGGG